MRTRFCRLCRKEKDEVEFRLNGKYRRTECHVCELDLKCQRDALPEQRKKHAEYERGRRRRDDVREHNRAYFKVLRLSEGFREKARLDPRRKASQKRWRSKESSKELRSAYYRFKRRTDIRYRLSGGFSRAVRRGLKSGKMGMSWRDMVGYSVGQLMAHLESLMESGMSWRNYGREWHIDHTIPVASFSFSSYRDEDFQRCWALVNLKPMWAGDNLRKGRKVSY